MRTWFRPLYFFLWGTGAILIWLCLNPPLWMAPTWGRMNPYMAGSSQPSACESWKDNSGASAGDLDIKDVAGTCQLGQLDTPDENVSVCEIDAWLTYVQGDISGYNYYFAIWTTDASENLVAKVNNQNSSTVAGNNGWSDTQVSFTFSPAVSISNGTEYAFVLTHDGAVSQANYAEWEYTANGATLDEYAHYYDCSGVDGGFFGQDFKMIIYTE